MRIGVDGGCWTNGRGYGRFTRELLRAVVARAPEDEWVFFLDEDAATTFDITGERVRTVVVPQRVAPARAAAADGYRSATDILRFTRAVWNERPAVFFSPSVYTYFPLPPRQAAVVAIHDVIAERFPELTLPTQRARLFWRAKVHLSLAQAGLIMTVSEYSARELERVLHVPRNRIRVVEEAPAAAYQPGSTAAEIAAAARGAGLRPRDRWFVYVGGFNPHKRVERLVQAHARAALDLPESPPHLLLVGSTDDDVFHGNLREIRETIRACGTEDLVHWTGFVPDVELRHLHAGAIALVLVSEAEGYGLPAVEAAACGTPVIATRESPLPELLADGGIFVAPGDERTLVQAMLRLASDERERDRLAANALRAARGMTWDRAAASALDALHDAAPGGTVTPNGADTHENEFPITVAV